MDAHKMIAHRALNIFGYEIRKDLKVLGHLSAQDKICSENDLTSVKICTVAIN